MFFRFETIKLNIIPNIVRFLLLYIVLSYSMVLKMILIIKFKKTVNKYRLKWGILVNI